MIVVARKVKDSTADRKIGEGVWKRHPFYGFHAKVFCRQPRCERRGKAANTLDRLGIRVRCKNLIPFPKKIDEVAASSTPGINDPNPGSDSASQELVKEVDINLAELLLDVGHGVTLFFLPLRP